MVKNQASTPLSHRRLGSPPVGSLRQYQLQSIT